MHAGDAGAVAGHADEADQALVPCLGQRLDGAAGAVRDLPLVGLDQVVELDQVDVVDLEALQRALELRAGRRSPWRSPVLVARKKRSRCSAIHGPDPQLGLAVGGGGVDVVDAEVEQGGEDLVGPSWRIPPRAAAPKITRVLSWPVRPNAAVGSWLVMGPPYDRPRRRCASRIALRFPIRHPFEGQSVPC